MRPNSLLALAYECVVFVMPRWLWHGGWVTTQHGRAPKDRHRRWRDFIRQRQGLPPIIGTIQPCRRCSECTGFLHHWIDGGGRDKVCKHCEVEGDECTDCTSGVWPSKGCTLCLGAGVVPIAYPALCFRCLQLGDDCECPEGRELGHDCNCYRHEGEHYAGCPALTLEKVGTNG